jgi:sporulation protein YlmC with PRC-barrel domain
MRNLRNLLLVAASTIAVASMSPAFAAQTNASSINKSNMGTDIGQVSMDPAKDLQAAELMGAHVYSGDDKDVGTINDLIVTTMPVEIYGVVIGVGAFLGGGDKNVVVPMERLKLAKDGSGNLKITIEATKEELTSAKAYESGIWMSHSYTKMNGSMQQQSGDLSTTTTHQQAATMDQSATTTTDQQAAATDQSATKTDQQAAAGSDQSATTSQPAATSSQSAQSTDTSTTKSDQSAIANTAVQSEGVGQIDMSAGNVVVATKLMGKTVYAENDVNVGDISDIVFTQDGKLLGIVVGVGGFLGMGEKNVAMPLSRFSFAAGKNGKIMVKATKAELNGAPAFVYPTVN